MGRDDGRGLLEDDGNSVTRTSWGRGKGFFYSYDGIMAWYV